LVSLRRSSQWGHSNARWAEAAIVSATFAPLTYRDLQRQLDGIRRQLRLAGFDCRARIGILMPNGAEAVLTIVALASCSIAVPD